MRTLSRKKKCELKWRSVTLKGRGVQSRSRIQTIFDAVLSAICLATAVVLLLLWYQSNYRIVLEQNLIYICIIFAALAFSTLFILREVLPTHHLMANCDFRLVAWIQNAPYAAFKYMLLIMIVGFLLAGQSLLSSPSFLLLVGLSLLLVPFYYSTRFYSEKGLARAYVLAFLEEREKSDTWLELASREFNQVLKTRGLRLVPCEFRAGVNLSIIRSSVDDLELRKLSDSIVNFGIDEDNNVVVETVDKILKEAEPGARILPARPIRDRVSADLVAKIASTVASLAAVVAYLLGLITAKAPIP